jgi:hypothetical protein
MINLTEDVTLWILVAVAAVDALEYWYNRVWLAMLNAAVALGVTTLAFLNDIGAPATLLGVALTLCAGLTLTGSEREEETFNPDDYVDAPRPGGEDAP